MWTVNELIMLSDFHLVPDGNIGAFHIVIRITNNTVAHVRHPTLAHIHNERDSSPIGALLEWRSSALMTLAARQLKTRALSQRSRR